MRDKLIWLYTDIETAVLFLTAIFILTPITVAKMMYRYYPLLFIAGVAAVARIPLLYSPLWYDEQFTLILSRLSAGAMVAATRYDVHPPLYYAIVAAWGHGPDWLIRVPSYLAGIAAVAVFYLILNKLEIGQARAKLICLVMALAPFQIYYSTEARMYSLLQLFILLALLAGLSKDYIAMAIAGLIACYLHNYGPIYLVVIAVALVAIDRSQLVKVAAAGAAIFILWLPWATAVAMQYSRLGDTGYWIPPGNIGRVVITLYQFIAGPALITTAAPAGIFIAMLWVFYSILWLLNNKPQGWALLLWLAAGPIVLAVAISSVGLPIFLFRALLAVTPFYYAILLYPLKEVLLWPRVYKIWVAIFIVPLLLISVAGLLRGSEIRQDRGSYKAAAYIAANWKVGDIIYHEQDGSAVYFRALHPELVSYSYPPCSAVGAYIASYARASMGLRELPLADLTNYPGRVWLLSYKFPYTPQCEIEEIETVTQGLEPELVINEYNNNSNFMAGDLYLLNR